MHLLNEFHVYITMNVGTICSRLHTICSCLLLELAEVKEAVTVKNSNGRYVPFKTLRNGTVAVSDISSGLWCELKVEYNHFHWKLKKTQEWSKMASIGNEVVLQTPEMKEGKAIHAAKGFWSLIINKVVLVSCVVATEIHVCQCYAYVVQ